MNEIFGVTRKLSEWVGFWPVEPMTTKRILKMIITLLIHLFFMNLPQIYTLLHGFKDSFLEKILCAAETMAFIATTLRILIAMYYNKDLKAFIIRLNAIWKVCKFFF